MSRSIGPAHIIRQHDGTSTGIWGSFSLESSFQPVFALDGGKLSITAYEGLIRPWRDGEASSPESFFGSIPAGDRPQAETLARTLHLLNAAACLPPHVSIFLRFDLLPFADRAVAERSMRDVRLVLNETGIDPRRLVCELTEKRPASAEALLAAVELLRAGGFRTAVDHDGAAGSDMKRIRDLRPDIVRFDASRATPLMETAPGFALVSQLVSSLAGEAVRTLFDGIEEGRQLELAVRSGASMVQGYVLARPELASAHLAGPAAPQPGGPLAPQPAGRLSGAAAGRAAAWRPSRPFGRRLAS